MKAAWYERQGAARDVLILGDMDDPHPRAGEVRIRVAFSGVNPGDVKKREDAFGLGMAYPRVIPRSYGAGTVDTVGEDVSRDWIGRRVWCHGAQSYRPFGTAAVGACAVQLAHQAGARVIATCRTEGDKEIAARAGADEVLLTGDGMSKRVRALAPDGVDHVVEVAFAANIKTDTEVLAQGGSVATYATNSPIAQTPVWQLVFVNAKLFFVGSDDVPSEAKTEATRDINKSLEAGWQGLDIAEIVPLDQIAHAHELVEHPAKSGRVIVAITL